MIFCVLFVIAAFYNFNINQIDRMTAFLYDLIDQLIYIKIPKELEIKVDKNMVYRLLKALYNFK